MDPLVKKVVDTGISKGVDFNEISSAMYNSGAGENQVLQAQEYYNQIKKKSPSVAGVSPSISGRTPSSSGFGPFKVKGQGDPNDPSGLYGQVEEANRRINTANRIYDVLSKKGELSPKEIESARKDYQEYRSFYPNLPIDPSKDVGLLTDNIARDRMNIKAKSQPDESNYRKWMDYIYQSQPGGENGFLATILRGTEKVAGDFVSVGGAVISFGGLINDETDAFYSSVFGEETAENYKKAFKDTPLEPGAISQAGMGVAQFGKGMAEQWNENTKKIAGNWGMNEEQYEKGPGEALLEGDFSTAGKGIAIGMLHTMPEVISYLLFRFKAAGLAGEAITANLISKGTPKWIAGAAGRARAMAPTMLPLYTGANYAEVIDDPEFTTGEKLLYAVGSAVGSTWAESVGGFGEYFLGGAAKKQAVNQVKSSIMQSIGRGTVDMLKAAGVEGAEEVLDGGIQQALGIALGDRKFDANSLLDGFLIGAAMGGSTNLISKSPSLIGLSSDMLTTIKITDELSKIQGALSDPSLSDVERDLLTNRARVANNEIRRAKNSAAIFFQGYTPEDLQETMTLNSEIRRQIDSMPSFKTDEAKSAAIQSVKDSVARLKQIESKYDSQKKQQVQGAVQAGAQPGGVPVEGAGTAATAPGGVLQNVGQTQEEQVAQQRTEQASAFNVRPRLKKMKVTAKNAPGAYRMMMDALSNYTDEFLQQNKTDRASVERGIKSLFDVISSLDAKGRTVEIDVMGSIDEANKLFGFEINEVDGKFEVSSKIPGANRVFDTKEGADAYTKRVLYRGVNMMSDGGDVKISVLLPAMLDNTGYHEALHSLEVFDDKSADKLVVSLMNAIKKLPVLDGRMIAFMESYRGKPEPERNSEYLAELGSMISSGEISVEIRDSVIKSLTKSFLDFFKNMIGSDVDVTPTAEQLARTFNDIAEKLGRGEKQPPYRKTRKKGEESGAVDRAETSQPKLQRIFADVIDGLYSPLENNILQSKQDKMPAKQWLDKFARTDEAYWTGLQEWLGNKQGSVSKQEIMDWLKDNRVEIREVVNGGLDGNDTKYSQYQLEGEKENYKELLVALPRKLSIPDGKYIVYTDKGLAQAREYIKGFETDKEALDWIKENEDKYPYTLDFETRKIISEIESGNVFKSTHFDEPNILVHLRMNTRYSQKENENYLDPKTHKPKFDEAFELIDNGDNYQVKKIGSQSPYAYTYDKKIMTDNNMSEDDLKEYVMAYNILGKEHPDFKENKKLVPIKVLLLEEVQSDWGQKGRKEGFDTREVPKAPFVTDTNAWTKLGLKIALREAVRQNADRLAWTTGEQQNERYDLSNQVDEIKVVNVSNATSGKYKWDITIKKDGDNIGSKQLENDKKLADYVGKDLAEKIITENPNNLDTKKYAGDNLKVGGKGMKGFYDKIVPDAAKAIVRELTGVQGVIDETKIELSGGDVSTQKSIDITPELKAAVQSGVPKFQLSGMSTNKFTDYLSTKYGVNLDIVGSLGKDGITLSRIIVPKENRKSGIGSSIMNEIIDYADANNERILLTPSDSFGGNVERLKKFYKNLGFIENKGRNRDFTTKESMYRNPVPKAASNFKGLSKRLSGDALLNAQDLSNELLDNGAKIDADGLVTVYHRTTDDKKAQIEQSGIMLGLEDGLFFSTKESGQAKGYGDAVIQLRIPIEKLQLDDTFGDEAHVRIPTSKPRQSVDVSAYLTQPKFQRAASDEISMDDFAALSKRLNKFFKGNVKIVDADTFEKESEKFTGEKLDLKSYDGDVYGAVLPNGVMFINGLDVNSLLHEHTHLFNQVVMKVNPRLWSSIKEAVKKTAEWSQVKRNPLYSNLKTDDEVADEVFSKIVGNAAKNGWQKYTNQSIYQNIKALAQKFYNTILDLFGVDYYKGMSASGLADLTLTELMGGVSTTPYQIDAKINELMSKLLKGTRHLNQVRFNIDPNSRKKFEKALGEKDGRALYEIFGNVQDPSKLIDFAKSKFPIKGTLSSIAKRSVKDNNGDVIRDGNFGSIVIYKEYEKFLNKELEQVVDKATLDPQDLLNEVGYTLFNPTNLNDARNSFLHYYKKGHNICTLNPGSSRFSGSFVTFIVRNDADQTPSAEDLTQDNLTDEWRKYLEKKGRKNSDGTYNLNGLMPDALDPYSTSVISLQIDKSNGSTKEISRYNHQIGSPDNIFSRDFDNLIEGLSDAMFKKFGVDKNTKQSTAQMPFGVIQDANGAYYNYIYETNGVYYGDGYYLENGVATLLDRGSERMVDGWVISNRGDGTATNIDRTTYGFFYGDVKKVNYIKGDEISLTTENGNFVFEVKNGAVVRLIDFPKKWRLDKFKELGIRVEYDENGNLILSGLGFARMDSSDVRYTSMLWADDIVGISRTANFDGTKIQSLGNLQYIKGYANFSNSRVQSLGELKYIGRDASFNNSQVQSLGELKYIDGSADFSNSQVHSLGKLKYISSYADFNNSQVQSLGELKYIGGGADFIGSQVQSLGELKYIGGNARFRNSQIQSLEELKYIGGSANFSNSQVQSLGELKYVGGGADFGNSQVQSLRELKYIGYDANFYGSQVQSLGELKYIGDYANFYGSQVQSLGELKYIRGNADFRDSQVQSLGELKYIGSRVIYSNSPIDSKIEDIKRKSEGSTAEILVRDADEFMTSMNREFEQFGKEIEEEATESQPKFQRIATFFSGAGTLEAAMTDPTSVMAVEYTPDYIKAYNEAFNTDYKARDVLDIDPQEVIDSNPDIFHASPTCKSFSKARIGTREAKEMDIKSAESVARVIRDAKPPVVTIENVPDYKGSLPYDKIISALKDSGYKYDEGIYNAADFGGIQQRRRLIIRAALNVDLPAIPDKKKPGDWFKALEPMIDSAPDSAFTGKSGDENWEVKRLLDMIKSGRLSADKPIITMGGSTDSGIASAANAGGPAPTLTSSSKQIPRIIMPDGRIKRVTPDMMRVLMGLPESYRIPDDWKTAKEVLGNGIDGNITRALIEPLSKKSEEFSKSQPKFQTPIDEAFDKSQALLDAMSKRGGIITNLVVRFADRSSSLKKKLIEANLKNARDLFVAQAGAGSRAKFFIDENFSPIYNGLNKENSEYLDKIIQLRRIIQIDEDFDSKGKPRIIHPSDKNGVPLNKERAEANLVDYESMFGSALYNDLINRSDLYFDAYKKLLSIMRDNGLITKELYDNLKSLLYQPRKFLDQFVSFEEGETTLDVKDLALNEAQIKTLQNGSDSEIMMNSKLLLAFSAKSVFSRVARNKTYTAISEAVKDPANDWISNKQLKNFKPVNYFVDGVREQFFIREDYQKQLYDSTRHLISPNVARVMRVLTGSAILKSFATQVNPLFALKNFPRDVLHVAMFTNIYGNNLYPALFRISRDAFRGMHDKMSNSKDFKEWLEYGGGMDFLSTEGFESRSVRVGAFNKIRDAMSTFGEYSEVGVRIAVYKKTKADLTDEFVKTNGRGPNKEESDTIKTQAAVASREIIDFAQGGSWAKAGENIIPYLNASIQGFRVGANYIVKNPKDFAVKFAQLSLAVGVIMFYNSMMADDDEWEKIQDGEKMRNFIIFTPFKDKDGNRYYIKIAKTQQAIAWITFAEMMSAKMLNETLNPDDDEKIADKYKIYGDRTYDALVDGLMTFFPKNPLDLKKEITSAIPAINALAAVNNYDTFINKQVSYDYQKVPAVYEDILDPDIPYFYKALSQSIHPVMEIGPKRLGTAVEKITTGAETSVIVAGAYYLLDNVARKVANLKTDELNLGEVPKGDSELNAISSMFSPLKGVVKKVNPNLKKYQYSEDLDDIALRGASSIKTIKNASRNLGEKYYDALRGQGDLTKDEVLKEVKDYRDMLIEKGVQKSQVESFVNAFKMSAKSSPRESWDAGYYDIMYSPSSDATVEIISKLKGDNLTDAELKEYFINYKKSTGYNIKNMGEVYSLYRKSRDKK